MNTDADNFCILTDRNHNHDRNRCFLNQFEMAACESFLNSLIDVQIADVTCMIPAQTQFGLDLSLEKDDSPAPYEIQNSYHKLKTSI